MSKKYHIQTIAANYLKNLMDEPETLNVHPRFLFGLEKEEFITGFKALHSLIQKLYTDIGDNPATFNMMLKESDDADAKNADYTNSNASFLRVPNLLIIVGVFSRLEADLNLVIDGGILVTEAKVLKITGIPGLLTKLKDYGFEISDFGKIPKAGEVLCVSYPDNRFMLVALKAMSEALLEVSNGNLKNYCNAYFFKMHPGLLENEVVKEPQLTIDHIYHVLDPVRRLYAKMFHETVSDIAKYKIRMGGIMRNDWSAIYTNKKTKRVLMSLQVNQDSFGIKLNLQNIGKYINLVAEMPEQIINAVCNNGWDCGNCNPRCSGGFAFEFAGTAHNKCHCGAFVFHNLTDETAENCRRLLLEEIGM